MTYQAREKTEFYVRLRQMAPSEASWTSQARQQQQRGVRRIKEQQQTQLETTLIPRVAPMPYNNNDDDNNNDAPRRVTAQSASEVSLLARAFRREW